MWLLIMLIGYFCMQHICSRFVGPWIEISIVRLCPWVRTVCTMYQVITCVDLQVVCVYIYTTDTCYRACSPLMTHNKGEGRTSNTWPTGQTTKQSQNPLWSYYSICWRQLIWLWSQEATTSNCIIFYHMWSWYSHFLYKNFTITWYDMGIF